ncbi:hypothetical protein WN51_03457 [Melipona quadrifasciata]|uniref:Uncharacterized protein n=1 Tax=Melipona quadrifasciata TaxID=166423 RepID=A0A0M9ADY0_9HYME|nr:hypothetical protein WN51_03457 [Melipona quadrifasciata]
MSGHLTRSGLGMSNDNYATKLPAPREVARPSIAIRFTKENLRNWDFVDFCPIWG